MPYIITYSSQNLHKETLEHSWTYFGIKIPPYKV